LRGLLHADGLLDLPHLLADEASELRLEGGGGLGRLKLDGGDALRQPGARGHEDYDDARLAERLGVVGDEAVEVRQRPHLLAAEKGERRDRRLYLLDPRERADAAQLRVGGVGVRGQKLLEGGVWLGAARLLLRRGRRRRGRRGRGRLRRACAGCGGGGGARGGRGGARASSRPRRLSAALREALRGG
jgi:hypothetical protein